MDGLPYERDAELADVIREAIVEQKRDRKEVTLADVLADLQRRLASVESELRGRNGE